MKPSQVWHAFKECASNAECQICLRLNPYACNYIVYTHIDIYSTYIINKENVSLYGKVQN